MTTRPPAVLHGPKGRMVAGVFAVVFAVTFAAGLYLAMTL